MKVLVHRVQLSVLTLLSIYIVVSLIGILLKFLDKDFVNGTVLVVNFVKFRMPTVRLGPI